MASSARIDELLKKFEENPRRYFAPLANEYRKAGDVERAIQLCREHLPQQPGHMSGHIVFGQALFEASQFDEARQVFTSALALDPENLIALRHLGDIARGEGDVPAARDWYQRVLDADPRNEEIAALLAAIDAGEGMGAHGEPASTAPADAAAANDIAPIHLSSGAFSSVAAGDATTSSPSPADDRSDDPPVAASGSAAPAPMSAMDFALASISDTAPERESASAAAESAFPTLDLDAAERSSSAAPDGEPQGGAHGESQFDSAYAAGGLGAGDEMELTPAHGASALVSRAEPPDDATSFHLGATAGGDDDRSPFDLVEDVAPSAAEARPAGLETTPDAAPRPAAAAPSPARAMDDRPLGLESMEFVPPSRDDDAGARPGQLLGDQETTAATPAAFVTETMAELYLQQGFRDEALTVYRELLAQSPTDANLRERVAQLESGKSSSVSAAGISDTVIEAARQRQTAPAPRKSAREFFAALAAWRPAPVGDRQSREADAETAEWTSGDDEAAAELEPLDAAALPEVADRAPDAAAVDEFGFPVNFDGANAVVHRDLGAPRLDEEPRGVDLGAALIGDDLALDDAEDLPPSAAIEPATLDYAADEQAAASTGEDAGTMSGFDVVPPEEMTGDRYGQTESRPEADDAPDDASFAAPPGVGRLSGPVDTLFGDGAVPRRDEAAASALASAFGGEGQARGETPDADEPDASNASEATIDTPRSTGRQATGEVRRSTGAHSAATATRPAGSELSLDHVFRETPRRGTEKRRDAPAFSFDQFFSDGASSRGSESPAPPTPSEGSAANGDEGADIEQFNAWLEGLKKK